MTGDLQDVAGNLRQLSQLSLNHQLAMETRVVDTLRDYTGIIHTLPVLVKLHEEAMDLFNASKEKDSVRGEERERERERGGGELHKSFFSFAEEGSRDCAEALRHAEQHLTLGV